MKTLFKRSNRLYMLRSVNKNPSGKIPLFLSLHKDNDFHTVLDSAGKLCLAVSILFIEEEL